MHDDHTIKPVKKAGKLKTIGFIVGLFLLITGVIMAGQSLVDGGTPKTSQPRATETPDPVKAKYGPNGDTMPDPTGTGPGSRSTMMGY